MSLFKALACGISWLMDQLIIAETGFGTGLNFLAVVDQVLRLKSSTKIDFISIEVVLQIRKRWPLH